MSTDPPVVVGFDGSPQSVKAVAWAAGDAARRRRDLRVVHAVQWPPAHGPSPGPMPAPYERGVLRAAEQVLADGVARARAVAPGLSVTGDLPLRQPAAALVAASEHAGVVVVGHRGRGGFAGLLLGSVGVELAAHAACPVVVVRRTDVPAGADAGRIIVGIDGLHNAAHTLRFAFEQASYRHAGITAVHAYLWPSSSGPGDMVPLVYDPDKLREEEYRALCESMGGWVEPYPDVGVRHAVIHGRAAAVLTELSAGAELVVVGSRGRGGFTGLLLGSVSQAVIHHAACPVAVVR
ncbi:universal stress protein [Dactylosporangium sp. NPDC051484]|uniref:universal stress protein n=1 Tax=Dactylosporangium sp. NPDC051484 TaxID=3154942 RepID=UPI00344B44AF